MTTPSDELRARLETSRKELLDLSLKNPLLNYHTLSARGVEIVGENSHQVFETLVTGKRTMPFLPASGEDKGTNYALWEEPEDATPSRRATRGLQTGETQANLQRRLLNTYRIANSSIEETGVNTLFLGLGMLKWFESDSSHDERWAPLVLVPVQLERTSVRAQFRVGYTGDDLGVNLSLLEKAKGDFQLELPGKDVLELSDSQDVDDYIAQFEEVVRESTPDRWVVDPNRIVLGFFSFNKLMMYLDLGHPEVIQSEIIGTLFGDQGFSEPRSSIRDHERVDDQLGPSDVFHVLDADSSQAVAIHDAGQGRNMIIQGPPGTGKSQTIANIVAEAVARGKNVLFVSEKMAALEVVKRRLDNIGLGDACLELHSHKANKRETLDELNRTLINSTGYIDAQDDILFDQLLRTRTLLNEYADAVNLPVGETGVSPSNAFGELLSLKYDTTFSPIPQSEVSKMALWSGEDYHEKREIVEDLQVQLQSSGVPNRHLFWGSQLGSFTPSIRSELLQKLETATGCLGRLTKGSASLAAATNLAAPENPSAANDLAVAAQRAVGSPDTTGLNLRATEWESDMEAVRGLVEMGLRWRRMLSGRTQSVSSALDDVNRASDTLASAMKLAKPSCFRETTDLLAAAKCAVAAPNTDWLDFSLPQWESQPELIQQLFRRGLDWQQIRAKYDLLLLPESWDTDFKDARTALNTDGRSMPKRIFSGDYRRAKKQLAAAMRGELPNTIDRQVALIDSIHEEQRLRAAVNSEYAEIAPVFGRHWNGHNTDWEAIVPAVRWWLNVQARVATGQMQRGAMEYVRNLTVRLEPETVQTKIEALEAAVAQYDSSTEEFEAMVDASISAGMTHMTAPTHLPYDQQTELISNLLEELPVGDQNTSEAEGNVTSPTRREPEEITREIIRLYGIAGSVLGQHWERLETEWEATAPSIGWWLNILSELKAGELTESSVDLLREIVANTDVESRWQWKERIDELVAALEAHRGSVRELQSALQLDNQLRFGNPDGLGVLSFVQQKQILSSWEADFESIQDLTAFNARADSAAQEGLHAIVSLAASDQRAAESLTDWFDRAWYECVVETALSDRPTLRGFNSYSHEARIARFQSFDRRTLEHNRIRVASAHQRKASTPHDLPERLVRLDAYIGAEKVREQQLQLRVLKREIEKRSRHKAIRRLLKESGSIIQLLKPVFMMSPLSIANYLDLDGVEFDLVVFDEASQVRPMDALGALLRAKKAVVVGDSRQLPPSSFFDRVVQSDDDDDNDESVTADLESILGLFASRGAPERYLRWHYRSRHESLIAISNQEFYDNRLMVFASPDAGRETTGLRFHHFLDAVYDRGRSQTNQTEAAAVAQAVMEHAVNTPDLSLGVAAFSQAQALAIADHLEAMRREDDSGESFFASHPDEPFFVKNLENVQGDERDVIFISIGYGPDATGQVSMNFGPLNNQGGERRLNVLITRAKRQCHVFSSLRADNLDLGRTNSVGVRVLKAFLEYAETGIMPVDVPHQSGFSVDSPFQREVARRLENLGYQVHQEVASGGKFVDIGVVDPERPGRYLMGIECDGASYHSSRSARDRDRLREMVLEDLGWKLHRVWSTDWFNNPERELKRAVKAIEQAKTELD